MGERFSNDPVESGYGDDASEYGATLLAKSPGVDSAPAGTSDAVAAGLPPDRDFSLSRTIENEIIPRLLLAHRTAKTQTSVASDLAADSTEIAAFVSILTRGSYGDARSFVEGLLARGVGIDAVIGDVLPAAARHVGWLWETDSCTFVDVTFALSRLQQLLRHHAPSLERALAVPAQGRRVLLSVMPGEQHTFGASVFEEILIGAAWDVVPDTPADEATLLRRVKRESFDIVGLSASTDGALGSMGALIAAIRTASSNRSVRVIIGGPAVQRCPDLASNVGADAVSCDPADAMARMDAMMESLRRPC